MGSTRLVVAVVLIWATLMFWGVEAAASDVVCPVCGLSYPKTTKACPNDGTDLTLVGREKPTGAGDEEKAEQEEPGEPDDEREASDTAEPSKYKRMDQQNQRRRSNKPQTGQSGYSDRRSRIGHDRRGPGTAASRAKRNRAEQQFNKEERQALADYEKRRAKEWENRQRLQIGEARAKRDRAAAEKYLLYGLGAPLTSLGYRLFWMREGNDAGFVNAAEIDFNLARYRLRAGLSTLIGVRVLPARDELIFLEHLAAGFQWPWRFSPYVVIRGGVGIMASERFGEQLVYLLTSLGAEVGVDSWITPWMAVTPSFGYVRCMLDNAYWDSFTFKISVGF